MINSILIFLGFIAVAFLFVYVRSLIKKGVMKVVKKKLITNSSIGRVYRKDGTEAVSGKKFVTGLLSFFNPVLWLKDIVSLFNLRKLTIYLVILGIIFGYGWYQGRLNSPVNVKLGWGREAFIQLNGETLHIAKDGNVYIEDSKTGEVLKHIKARDMKGLRMKLAPYALQLKPFILAGASAGTRGDMGIEGGVGVSFARMWKANLDAFLTNKGVYLGSSYKLTDNSGIGVGIGHGWRRDELRGIIYYKFEF